MTGTNINGKAEKFKDFVIANNMKFFSAEETGDELNSVFFRTDISVNGQKLPLLLSTDDSIYTMIKIRIAPHALKEHNKERLLEYMNKLNASYKVFKYSANDGGDIMLDISLPCGADFFDVRVIMALIDLAIQHLGEAYPEFMKIVWADKA